MRDDETKSGGGRRFSESTSIRVQCRSCCRGSYFVRYKGVGSGRILDGGRRVVVLALQRHSTIEAMGDDPQRVKDAINVLAHVDDGWLISSSNLNLILPSQSQQLHFR